MISDYKINIVLSARDEEIELLVKHKRFFDNLDCFLLLSNEKSIRLCRDKYKLALFFSKNNIPHPKTYLYEDLKNNNTLTYPLICKPRFGKGNIGIFLANDFCVIQHQISNYSDYIFQEHIKGMEYTIDVLHDLDENVLSIIPRKRVIIKGGESVVSITEHNDKLINYAQDISEKIGFIGHINIQCIMKKEIPYFIEINPRFGGASNLSFKAGMDSPFKIMQMLKGEKIESFIGEFKANLLMLRYSQDFFIETTENYHN